MADVTPIALTDAENGRPRRHVANPNVLIELGYAKKAIGTAKIIQVWNTAFTACKPEDLPFDMRGRRGPVSYKLEPGSSRESRQAALADIVKILKGAISAILDASPGPQVVDAWQPPDEKDPSIWPTEGGAMTINEPDHGSGIKRIFPPPRSYVRILPSRWIRSDTLAPHDVLLGPMGGFSWGETRGGLVTYPGTIALPQLEKIDAVTKRFPTGEVWATKTGISGKHNGTLYIYGDEIVQYWADFLRYELKQMIESGAEPPFQVRVGVAGLAGLHWSVDSAFGRPPVALEDSFERHFTLSKGDPEEIFQALLNAWIDLRRVFSVAEPSMPQRQGLMMRLR